MGLDTVLIRAAYTIKVSTTRYVITDNKIYRGKSWDLVTDTAFKVPVFAGD